MFLIRMFTADLLFPPECLLCQRNLLAECYPPADDTFLLGQHGVKRKTSDMGFLSQPAFWKAMLRQFWQHEERTVSRRWRKVAAARWWDSRPLRNRSVEPVQTGGAELVSVAGEHRSRDFCQACVAEMQADLHRCRTCGSSAVVEPEKSFCSLCQQNPPAWKAMVVFSGYGDRVREAVLRAKRPSGEPVALALGSRLAHRVRLQLPLRPPILVVPVPMHWRRQVCRGTSAANVMASAVARGLGGQSRGLLHRVRPTPMQNTLLPDRRSANVRDAFRADDRVRGQTVLLVDDVVTTGATVAACTQALLAAGARDVYVATVAKAERTDWLAPGLS
jgi:ComF family protein